MDRLVVRFQAPPHRITGIGTLDDVIGRSEPGTALMITSAVLPLSTTLALQVALTSASEGRAVRIASNRSSELLVAERLLTLASGIDGQRLLRVGLSKRDWQRVGKAVTLLTAQPIVVVGAVLQLELLQSVAAEHVGVAPHPVVIVDGIEPLVAWARSASRDLRAIVESSSCAWVFTARSWGTPTASAEAGRGIGDVVVELRCRGNRTSAQVVHGHGWIGEVDLHQRFAGGRYVERIERRCTEEAEVAVSAAETSATFV